MSVLHHGSDQPNLFVPEYAGLNLEHIFSGDAVDQTPAPTPRRGGCHRSVPEALMKGLAAKWYPDAPEAAHWKRYAELGFGDFWKHKEVQQNDTGYFPGPIFMLLTCGDQYLGDDRAVTDPAMQRLWKRLTVEVTPDGAVNPCGP